MTIIEVNNRGSPEKGEQRNKTKIAAAMHLQRSQQVAAAAPQQLQGSQGQQLQTTSTGGAGGAANRAPEKKIAVISMTTTTQAKLNNVL